MRSIIITITTLSRAANARISAHDTVRGQTISSTVLASCMTGKPLKELLFAGAVCSLSVQPEVQKHHIPAVQPMSISINNTNIVITFRFVSSCCRNNSRPAVTSIPAYMYTFFNRKQLIQLIRMKLFTRTQQSWKSNRRIPAA